VEEVDIPKKERITNVGKVGKNEGKKA